MATSTVPAFISLLQCNYTIFLLRTGNSALRNKKKALSENKENKWILERRTYAVGGCRKWFNFV